jgi:hypothetical protein
MGLMVNFQSSYGEYAASIHKNVAALTQQEKAEWPARCSLFPGTPTN